MNYKATPSSITRPDGQTITTDDPLSWLFHETEKGAEVELAPGDYAPPLKPVLKTQPSLIFGPIDPATPATIKRGTQDTIFFAAAAFCHRIELRNLTILGSWRSAVHFKATEPTTFDDFTFRNCVIDGGWDFAKREGTSCKWGVMGHRTNGFSWIGGKVGNIRDEHCFYLHNTGSKRHLISHCELGPAGRTLVQVVGRPTENGGSPSLAPFDLISVKGVSAGLADGGSAFTFAGQRGRLVLRDVEYRHGFDAFLSEYLGTGALVLWPEYDGSAAHPGTPNGDVYLIGCDFAFAKGFGKAPVIQASACDKLVIGNSKVQPGLNPIALEVNKFEGGTAGAKFPLKELEILPGAQLLGQTVLGGTKIKASAA